MAGEPRFIRLFFTCLMQSVKIKQPANLVSSTGGFRLIQLPSALVETLVMLEVEGCAGAGAGLLSLGVAAHRTVRSGEDGQNQHNIK